VWYVKPWTSVFELPGKLARRGENQHAGEAALVGRGSPRPEHAIQNRKEKRRGLAGAGVGAGDQIVAVHDDRNHGALNRRRDREAAYPDAFD
jgi:hypothetical protein